MPKRPTRDDLFVIFPDLPWQRRRPSLEQMPHRRRKTEEAQGRVRDNSRRQQVATEQVRAAIAGRSRRFKGGR
jgi:hypothetical protein